MKPGMKMLTAQYFSSRNEQPRRSEYGGNSDRRMIGYDRDYETENRRMYGMEEPEARRRRDSRGRYMEGEGWEGNRNYPRSEYDERRHGEGGYPHMGGYPMEARRRRDSRGRYMMGGMEYDDDDDDMRSQTWYPPHGGMPPMGMSPGNSYGDIYAHGSIYAPGAMNKPMGGMMGGGGDMSQPVDEHTARMWVGKMDGGEKFKIEQTEQQRMAICPDCEKWEFYTAMNAMHSDHCESAKKLGVDRPDYYAHLAKDFLKDKDAKPGKLRRYMEHIAK